MSEREIKKRTYDLMLKDYMTHVNNLLLSDQRLELLSPGIGHLLCDHSKAVLLMGQSNENLVEEYDAHIEKYESDLKQNYRIRSRVSEWLNECVQKEGV